MGTRPLVGVTPNYDAGDLEPLLPGQPLLFVHPEYLRAVAAGGAIPVVLPLCPQDPGPLLDQISALVVTGNEKPLPQAMRNRAEWPPLADQNPVRHASDTGWVTGALERQMPLLGICRGMQVLNEVLGGSLCQRPFSPEQMARHHQRVPGDRPVHALQVQPDSLLARLLGREAVAVNSFHAQALGRVARDLWASGHAHDGVVEAVEAAGHPFCLGVQFHPEKLAAADRRFLRIFGALADAARAYRHRSEGRRLLLRVVGLGGRQW